MISIKIKKMSGLNASHSAFIQHSAYAGVVCTCECKDDKDQRLMFYLGLAKVSCTRDKGVESARVNKTLSGCVFLEECWDVLAVVDVGQSDSPAHE